MELIVLGADGTYAGPGGACSGFLVREDGFTLWMDAGNGTLARLQEHVAIEDVDAIFLSHTHPDHCADLFPFFYARAYGDDPPSGIPVVAPPGTRATLGQLIGEASRPKFTEVFAWEDAVSGAERTLGPLRLRYFDSDHSAVNATLRIEAGGKALCYSGDTGPNDALPRAAEGADLFLCEATWQDANGDAGGLHLRASEAGAAAKQAGAGSLVLTHIRPRLDGAVSRGEAEAVFDGSVGLARETVSWRI